MLFPIGLAVLDPKSSGKLGLYALTYYFCTTILAAVLGIILVSVIRPGERASKVDVGSTSLGGDPAADQVTTLDAIFDLFRYENPKRLTTFSLLILMKIFLLEICLLKIYFKQVSNKQKQQEV